MRKIVLKFTTTGVYVTKLWTNKLECLSLVIDKASILLLKWVTGKGTHVDSS